MTERPLLLSVVIPTLDEQTVLGQLLGDLRGLSIPHEVIVVDGGSGDLTRDVARAAGARIVESAPGRGVQLATGAGLVRSPLLLFIHAGVRLDQAALALLDEIAVARPPCAMAFRLRIDARGLAYRLIEWGATLRSRLFSLPCRDQGLLVRRSDYVRSGGYRPLPRMRDDALVREVRRVTPIHLLDARVRVSPRRRDPHGPVARVLHGGSRTGGEF